MYEPGLDREYWETEWAEFEADLQDSPMESLSEVDDLIARMLVAAGYPIDTQDPVDEEGIDPEIHRAFLAARDVTRLADNGTDVDPGDVAQAINDYRALYEHLLAREIDTST